MKYKLLYCNTKRPKNSRGQLKKELLDYLKEEFKKKHIPSRREIERNFRIRLNTISKNINSIYEEAGLTYKLIQNQNLKANKAELLLKIVLNNLEKFGFELISFRGVRERGVDIIAKRGNKKIGIELKAYNKYEKLKQRDIQQVNNFIKKEELDSAIIITTSDIQDKFLEKSDKINIVLFKELIKLISDKKEIKELSFIQNHSINIEDAQKEGKRQRILDYVLSKYKKENNKPTYNEILKDLHLDIYTYFNNLFEIYKILRIPPPLKNMGGIRSKKRKPDMESVKLWKEEFKRYILFEIKKGRKYPSGEEIGKHFGISHIWNIIKVSDLYKELNLKPYLEREHRTTFVQES